MAARKERKMYSEEVLADGRIRLGTFDPEHYWQWRVFENRQEIEEAKKPVLIEDVHDG
jgi:hypothetical protein